MNTRNWSWIILLSVGLTACGEDVAEEAYDGEATAPPPPAPALEGAATSGPSVTVSPDTSEQPEAPR